MSEIRVESKPVNRVDGIIHLYLVYRPDTNSTYDDWKIIRIGPTNEGHKSPWGATIGEIGIPVITSTDKYNLSYIDYLDAIWPGPDPSPYFNWTDTQNAVWLAENLHGSAVVFDEADGDVAAK